MANVKDFNGKTTTYGYDSMDRVQTRTADGSFMEPAVGFTYTKTGKRLTMTDGNGVTSYTYDGQDRLATKTTAAGTLTYRYDASGNLVSVASANPNGASSTYTYDQLNRLATVNGGVGYNYDAAGRLTSASLLSGSVTVTPAYDQMNRTTELMTASVPSMIYQYTYGKTGNRLTATDKNGGSKYTYDSIYRMTGEAISRSEAKGTLTYALDAVGNRQSVASTVAGVSSQAASYDANDRVTGNVYDANGNTQTAGGKTYGYDSMDRLTKFNGGSVTMVYDGDGNRVAKVSGGVTTQYLMDELNPTGLPQVMEEVVAGGGAADVCVWAGADQRDAGGDGDDELLRVRCAW
jgi:YD repeat-containing protein